MRSIIAIRPKLIGAGKAALAAAGNAAERTSLKISNFVSSPSLFLLYTHTGTVYCGIFATLFLRDDTLLCVGEHEDVRRSWIYGEPEMAR